MATTSRFLSLPTELRLMVYEMLPVEFRRRSLDLTSEIECSLITYRIDPAILSVCHSITAEAKPILDDKLKAFYSESVGPGSPRTITRRRIAFVKKCARWLLMTQNPLNTMHIVLHDSMNPKEGRYHGSRLRSSMMYGLAGLVESVSYLSATRAREGKPFDCKMVIKGSLKDSGHVIENQNLEHHVNPMQSSVKRMEEPSDAEWASVWGCREAWSEWAEESWETLLKQHVEAIHCFTYLKYDY